MENTRILERIAKKSGCNELFLIKRVKQIARQANLNDDRTETVRSQVEVPKEFNYLVVKVRNNTTEYSNKKREQHDFL